MASINKHRHKIADFVNQNYFCIYRLMSDGKWMKKEHKQSRWTKVSWEAFINNPSILNENRFVVTIYDQVWFFSLLKESHRKKN